MFLTTRFPASPAGRGQRCRLPVLVSSARAGLAGLASRVSQVADIVRKAVGGARMASALREEPRTSSFPSVISGLGVLSLWVGPQLHGFDGLSTCQPTPVLLDLWLTLTCGPEI